MAAFPQSLRQRVREIAVSSMQRQRRSVKGQEMQRKLDAARAEVNTLLAMYPRYDQALYQLGEVNAAENKWKEAEAAYQRSYEANPRNIQGLLAIAHGLV